jgi:2-dehydro-3-deoxy-L-rhamnonate dehydrogenase (NAD+)
MFPRDDRRLTGMNQIDLKDRCAVVTGGARGIGYAIAERLVRSGAQVSIWDVDPDAGAEAALELSKLGGMHVAHVDVTSDESVKKAAER